MRSSLLLCMVFCLSSAMAQEKIPDFGPLGPGNGAWRQVEYFQKLDFPYGHLSADQMIELKKQLADVPDDRHLESGPESAAFNVWHQVGPFGANVRGSGVPYSGRVRYLEITDSVTVRAGAASGGLWEFDVSNFFTYKPLSENLNSEWIGAFATNPTNKNDIILGTGEPSIRSGTGLWRTLDGGKNWTSVTVPGSTPNGFYAIKYDPSNTNKIHVASTGGYFQSNNGGQSWVRTFNGNVTDVEIDSNNPQNVYIARWGSGIYKSTNGGTTFSILSNVPFSNVGRTSLAICKTNPNIVFALIANNSNNQTNGIYKTTNGGQSWVTCRNTSGLQNFHGRQGYYNNIIEVDPNNCGIVYAGGVQMLRASDGFSFSQVTTPHVDNHAIAFDPRGVYSLIGVDGGIYYSTTSGQSWRASNISRLPVTQYYSLAKAKQSHLVMGGTQDNGMSNYFNGAWSVPVTGDAGGVAIAPDTEIWRFVTIGVFSNGVSFQRFKTHNDGANWSGGDLGIRTWCRDFATGIRISDGWPFKAYTYCDSTIYESTDVGNLWKELNATNFSRTVRDLTISRGIQPDVFVTLNGAGVNAFRFDTRTRTLKSLGSGLLGSYVEKFVPHPSDSLKVYAVMGGFGTQRKLYYSDDRGDTWSNITGNMPNVSLTDLIVHPQNPNLLYLGHSFGLLKSSDGGQTWNQWVAGLPQSVSISEMDYVDSTASNGTVWVYFSSYGRGIWKREVSGDDAAASLLFKGKSSHLKVHVWPTPSRDLINVRIKSEEPDRLRMFVHDLSGKILQEEKLEMSDQILTKVLNIEGYPPGTYILNLEGEQMSYRKRFIKIP